jgi:hypothetical protein
MSLKEQAVVGARAANRADVIGAGARPEHRQMVGVQERLQAGL